MEAWNMEIAVEVVRSDLLMDMFYMQSQDDWWVKEQESERAKS